MTYFEKIERLKTLLMSISTNSSIDEDKEKEYTLLRRELNAIHKFKMNAPKELKTCTTLTEFRREMQKKGGYAPRREYINDTFNPLLDDEESLLDSIQDIEKKINFGHLNLLPIDIQEKGRNMSDVYLYLYCIENSLRIFIEEIMKSDPITIPNKVQDTIDKLKRSEKESKYLPLRGNNNLFYCDFIELGKIIVANWSVFGRFFPKQNEHWLNVMIDELYKIRCLVAHNSYVGQDERDSLKVYYKNIIAQLKI